jgi:uncharacterized protein
MSVRRFDFLGTTHKLETTSQGFVRVDARLTRTGIFTYKQDGKTLREFRPSEEVFRADSMKSIAGAPVTDLHPIETGAAPFVGPENAKALAIGFAGEEVAADGEFVTARLTITDAKAIAALKDGSRKEISLGYTCDVEHTPGVSSSGERYDAVQRNIVVNHIALGPPGWGRGGPEVALRLDSKDAIQIEENGQKQGENKTVDDTTPDNKDTSATATAGTMTTIMLDGTDFDVSEELKAAILAEFEKRDGDKDKSESPSANASASDASSQKLDSLARELARERKLRQDAQNPKMIEARVSQRLKLMNQCQSVLGSDVRLDGKTDRELKELVIKSVLPDANLSSKASAHLDGMFEGVIGHHSRRQDSSSLSSLANVHTAIHADSRLGGAGMGAAQNPIERRREESRTMWKKPLAHQ